jgi:hypothetical protein
MRGSHRAYDPHLAVRRQCQLSLSRLVWAWGSPPPSGVGLSGELTSPSGSCFGHPMGMYPPFTGGLSHEVHVSPALAGNIFGCGLGVVGVVHVGGQGWFGEVPEHPVFFVILLPALRAGRAHHCSKGRHQGSSFPSNLARIYV